MTEPRSAALAWATAVPDSTTTEIKLTANAAAIAAAIHRAGRTLTIERA